MFLLRNEEIVLCTLVRLKNQWTIVKKKKEKLSTNCDFIKVQNYCVIILFGHLKIYEIYSKTEYLKYCNKIIM